MASLIKISDAGAMALHAGVYLASLKGNSSTSHEMAELLQVSEAHLVKVLQRLTRAGIVRTTRGPKGGYSLAISPEQTTTLRKVFEAIEGDLTPVKCLLKTKVCKGQKCILGDLVHKMNKLIMSHLSETRLDMAVKKGPFNKEKKQK